MNKQKNKELKLALLFYNYFNNDKSLNAENIHSKINSFEYNELYSHLDFNVTNKDLNEMIEKINHLSSKDLIRDEFNEIKKSDYDYIKNKSIDFLSNLIISLSPNVDNQSVYDPTLGYGEFFVEANKNLNISNYYGEEIEKSVYNIAMMNMLINNIEEERINIINSDSINNSKFLDKKFDLIISEPPFVIHDLIDESKRNDSRFELIKDESIRSITDFSFIFHSLSLLKEEGTFITFASPSILFSKLNKNIRKVLINDLNVIEAIIRIPNEIHKYIDMHIHVIVFKKNRNKNSIQMIDLRDFNIKASKREKALSKLKNDLIEIYLKKIEKEYVSKEVSFKEIENNNYNLNVRRYIYKEEETVRKSNDQLLNQISKSQNEIKKYDKTIDELLLKLL